MRPTLGSLAIAALVVVGGLAAQTAQAGARAPAAAGAASTPEVRLRDARTALARANAELARMRAGLAARRAPVRTLRTQAARLDAALGRSLAQVDAAQAQLAAKPTPLEVAEEQVGREIAYARGLVPYSRGQLVAEAAMDYVAGHVSATAYGYLEAAGAVLPPLDPAGTLAAQAGICGNAAVTFAAVVHHFGYPARSVSFYYTDPGPAATADGHVGVEVLYGGSWHYFDPTFGLFWTDGSGDVLSIDEVRAGLGTLQKNVASFTNVVEDEELGNDTWFETDAGTSIVIGAWTRG